MKAPDRDALDGAIRALEERLSERRSPRVLAPLAEAYRLQGRVDEAVALARDALGEFPDHLSIRVVLARALALDRSDEAEAAFRVVLAGDPDNIEARAYLDDCETRARAEAPDAALTPPSPADDRPSHDEPPADQPPRDEPAADRPPHDEPPADQPPRDEPAADRPSHDEPPADQPPRDEPAADRPPDAEPAADRPPLIIPSSEDRPMIQPAAREREVGSLSLELAHLADLFAAPVDPEEAGTREDELSGIATLTLAEIYARQGLFTRAIEICEAILERNTDDLQARTKLEEYRQSLAAVE